MKMTLISIHGLFKKRRELNKKKAESDRAVRESQFWVQRAHTVVHISSYFFTINVSIKYILIIYKINYILADVR